MKLLGYFLMCIAVLITASALALPLIIPEQRAPLEAMFGMMAVGFMVLIYGTIVYGIGRMVEELTLIRKYLKQRHYSDSAKAADLMDQIRRTKDGQP